MKYSTPFQQEARRGGLGSAGGIPPPPPFRPPRLACPTETLE